MYAQCNDGGSPQQTIGISGVLCTFTGSTTWKDCAYQSKIWAGWLAHW